MKPGFPVLVLLAIALAPAASAVQVTVFRDNPIVALRDPGFRDNALSLEDPAFAPALVQVELGDARQLGPVEALQQSPSPLAWGNDRIVIADGLGVPDGSVTRRDDPRFLELMVFVYANRALARLEAMGYTHLTEEMPVYAYAHDPPAFRAGLVPSPSPWPDAYVPTQRQMHFMLRAPSPLGDGGMGSSAEDAEVVLHELGHIVHARSAPQVEWTADWYGRWAEGVGDLFAALMAEEWSQGYGDACLAEWMVTYYPESILPRFSSQGLDCLRVLDGGFVYPADGFGEVHRDSQFWSGALWEVRQSIGNEATLRLLMESFPLMPERIGSFEDIGEAVLKADAALYGGRDEALLRDAFAARGIELRPLAELLGGKAAPEPMVPAVAAPEAGAAMAEPASDDVAEAPGLPAALAVAAVVAVAAVAFRRRQG